MSDVYRLEYRWQRGLIQGISGFHYQTDPDVGESEPSASNVVDAISDKLTTAFRGVTNANTTVLELVAREEVAPGSGDVPAVGVKTINLAGTLTAPTNEVVPEMCPLLHRKTPFATRSARGWTFLPPIANQAFMSSLGQISGVSALATGINALIALLDDTVETGGIGSVTLRPVVYSRTRRGRGQNPWTFNIDRVTWDGYPHFLRSRHD